ncbi:MAG: TonB-dependent receptor plug domain-containing protein [Bacteroidales bacterium]
MNKIVCFFLLVMFFVQSFAQQSDDTVVMSKVTVIAHPERFFSDGAKLEIIDSAALSSPSATTLSDVLMQSTTSLVKSYGHSGAASSLSLRGAGASRSAVLWEGFQLNSITMGEADLSLLPAQAFNYVAIDHSGSGTLYGSGSVGGALNLGYKPRWRTHKDFSVSLSQASFQTYNASFQHTIENTRMSLSGTSFYVESEGDFPYYDYVRLDTFNRTNAAYNAYGLVENFHYKFSHTALMRAGLWYQVKNAELPGILGSSLENAEHQKDSSLRVFALFKKSFDKSIVTIKSGLFNTHQLYTKKMSSIDSLYSTYSDIHNTQTVSSLTYKMFIHSDITAHVEGVYTYKQARVADYGDNIREQQYSAIAGVQYSPEKISISGGFRQDYVPDISIPFIYSCGLEYYCDTLPLVFRITIGKKYRRPTFNDLYWLGWGNPDLVSEHGFSFECGAQYTYEHKRHVFVSDVAVFNADINDMIMWKPSGSVWTPMNVSQARIQGAEFRLVHSYATYNNAVSLNQKIGYDVNTSHVVKMDSDNSAEGHQLYYVPKYSFHYAPSVRYDMWHMGAHVNYQSLRYYGAGKFLPSYYTLDLFVNYTFSTQDVLSDLRVSVTNISDVRYELIRSYPMPGRAFEFSLNFKINK